MIDLYFWPTENGKKIIICLEECGIPYKIKPVNIHKADQFAPDYLKINPNNRIPTIVDHEPRGGGGPLSIFESGAIMMYLAEKAGRFWPQDAHKKYDVAQWVIWQAANLGPKLGEQNHYKRRVEQNRDGDLSYPFRRYADEAHRLFGVMNLGLFQKRYFAAGEYTIADMMIYPWACTWKTKKRGIDIDEFPHVKPWLEEIGSRPAVKKALVMGPEFEADNASVGPEELEQRLKHMHGQRALPIPKEWLSAT
jgi:GST-like protein